MLPPAGARAALPWMLARSVKDSMRYLKLAAKDPLGPPQVLPGGIWLSVLGSLHLSSQHLPHILILRDAHTGFCNKFQSLSPPCPDPGLDIWGTTNSWVVKKKNKIAYVYRALEFMKHTLPHLQPVV